MKKLSGPNTLIIDSFRMFFKKQNFIIFLKIYLVLLPFLLFSLLNLWDRNSAPFFTGNLVYLLVSIWTGISGIITIDKIYKNQDLNLKMIFIEAWRKLGKVVLFDLVLILIIVIGLILLIIPGIIFGIWFSFAKYKVIFDGQGIKDSLKASKNLVKGRFFAILGRLIIFVLFLLVIQILVSFIPYGLGTVLTTIFGGLFLIPYYLLYQELLANNT